MRKSKYFSLELLGFVGVVLPLLALFIFVFPCYDDYWYAHIAMKNGIGNAQVWWYTNAQGRYLSNFLISLDLLFCRYLVLYRLVLLLMFSGFLLSTYALTKKFIGFYIPGNKRLIFFSFFILVSFFFLSVSGISEILYWLPGVATYTLGLILINYVIIYLFFKNNIKPSTRYVAIILLSLAACGTGEMTAMMLLGAYFIFFVSRISKRADIIAFFKTREFFIFCGIALVIYFIILKCPGSHERFLRGKIENPETGNAPFARKWAIRGLINFYYNILFAKHGIIIVFITAIGYSLFVAEGVKDSIDKTKVFITWLVVQSVFVFCTLIFIYMFAYNTGTRIVIPRALASFFYIAAVDFVFSGMLLAVLAEQTFQMPGKYRPVLATLLMLVFFDLVFFDPNSNIKLVYKDLYGHRVAAYTRYYDKQRNDFIACKAADTSASLNNKPLLYVWDLAEDHYKTRYLLYYTEYLCSLHNP